MMFTRRAYTNMLKLIAFLIISYFAYSFIYYYISHSKLKVINKEHKFKISSIVNISENRLNYEAEYYLKGQFFGISSILDSTYYLSMIKVGKLDTNKPLSDILTISGKQIPERTNWFTKNDIILKSPASINEPFAMYFNTSVLPVNKLKKINIYIGNKILSKNIINNEIIEITVKNTGLSFSFNDLDKNDFKYGLFYGNDSSIIFIEDKFNNLYIMNLAPIIELKTDGGYKLKVPYKSLQEILEK